MIAVFVVSSRQRRASAPTRRRESAARVGAASIGTAVPGSTRVPAAGASAAAALPQNDIHISIPAQAAERVVVIVMSSSW